MGSGCPVLDPQQVGHLLEGGGDELPAVVVDGSVKAAVHRHPALQQSGDDVLRALGLHEPGHDELGPHVDDVQDDLAVPVDLQVNTDTLVEPVSHRDAGCWLVRLPLLEDAAPAVLRQLVQLVVQQLLVPDDGGVLQEGCELGLGLVTRLLVDLGDDVNLLLLGELLAVPLAELDVLDGQHLLGLLLSVPHDHHHVLLEGSGLLGQDPDHRVAQRGLHHPPGHPEGSDLLVSEVEHHPAPLHRCLGHQQRDV